MSLEGENLGRWKSELRSIGQILPFPRFYLLWSPSLASFTSSFPFFLFPPSLFSFFLSFFLSFFSGWEHEGGEISPREILNDEDFNFNVVEILHPVDRTPFYLQSLENFHSSLSFPTIPLFSFQFSSIEQSLLYRPILNIGFSLMRSWHIKNDIV